MQALVVDDSSTMRKLLKSILLREEFEVVEAKDSIEALACLERNAPDVALLDWNMPQMSGLEVLGRIRADHNYDQMRVMMVTTESEQEHIQQALREGADEYVMKPFTRDAVIDKLQILGWIR